MTWHGRCSVYAESRTSRLTTHRRNTAMTATKYIAYQIFAAAFAVADTLSSLSIYVSLSGAV